MLLEDKYCAVCRVTHLPGNQLYTNSSISFVRPTSVSAGVGLSGQREERPWRGGEPRTSWQRTSPDNLAGSVAWSASHVWDSFAASRSTSHKVAPYLSRIPQRPDVLLQTYGGHTQTFYHLNHGRAPLLVYQVPPTSLHHFTLQGLLHNPTHPLSLPNSSSCRRIQA